MAYNAGAAFVQIKPSLRGFHAQLRNELRGINEVLTVKIRPVWDTPVVLPPLPTQEVRVRARWDGGALPRVPDQTARVRTEVDRATFGDALIKVASLGRALRTLALPAAIGGAAPVIAAIGSAAVTASGALLALPAAALAAGAGIATVKLATTGMGDAFKALAAQQEQSGATASAAAEQQAAAAKRIRDAARGVEDAQRQADRTAVDGARQVQDARRGVAAAITAANERVAAAEQRVQRAQETRQRAQESLTRAVRDAREAQEDLALSLSGAALSEESALLGLERARERLAAMPADSTALDYREAELAVRQAEQAVKETAERHVDLQQESAESARVGINGAQGVVEATRSVQEANRGVADAEAELTQARAQGARDVQDANQQLALAQESAAQANADAARAVQRAQEALSEAYTDTGAAADTAGQKAAAALAKLAPAAREFVAAVQQVRPAFDAMRLEVQQQFFEGLGRAVRTLAGTYLPILRDNLRQVAAAMGASAQVAGQALMAPTAVAAVNLFLAGTAQAFRNLIPAVGNVITGIVGIGGVGAQYLPAMGQAVTDLTERFKAWVLAGVESGRINDLIVAGIDAIRQLGELFGNVGSIIASVFTAAQSTGGGFLGTMIQVTGEVARFLSQGPGFQALVTIFQTIKDVVAAVLPALLALGTAAAETIAIVGPVLPQIAAAFSDVLTAVAPLLPVFGEVAAVLGGALAEAIRIAAPLLGTIADVVGRVLLAALDALRPILPIILDAFERLVPPLQRVAEQIGGVLIGAIELLAPLLPPLVESFFRILDAVVPLVEPLVRVAGTILDALLPVVPKLAEVFLRLVQDALVPLLPPLIRLVEAVLPGVVSTINVLIPVIEFLANILIDVLVWAINTLVIPAINAIAAAIEWLNGFWRGAADVVTVVWTAIGAAVTAAWNFIRDAFNNSVTFLRDLWNGFWNTLRDVATEVWNGISNFLTTAFNAFSAFFSAVWTGIRDFFTFVWNGIRDTAVDLWNAIAGFFTDAFNGFVGFFSDTWNGIVAFFRFTWDNLRQAGVDAWNGIRGFFEGAFNKFVEFFRFTWDGIVNTFRDIWNGITKIVDDVWFNIRTAFVSGINVVIGIINGFAGVINKVAGLLGFNIDLRVDPLPLPARFATGGPVDIPARWAMGGQLPGYAPGQDRIHALLSPGEYVIRPEAARVLGTARLDALNAAHINGDPALYAGGGRVLGGEGAALPRFAAGGYLYPQMASIVQRGVPGTRVTSTLRPGDPGYHGRGKAVDLAGPRSMDMPFMLRINRWLAQNWGGDSAQLIHTQPGAVNLLNGRPHSYNAGTRADHRDHVHWAVDDLDRGGIRGFLGAIGGAIGDVWNFLADQVSGLLSGPRDLMRARMNEGTLPEKFSAGLMTKIFDHLFGTAEKQDAAMMDAGPAATGDQIGNARIIGQVARSMGFGRNGLVVALATALQESGLRNINYGDRDSVGLFQQRPSQGWGNVAQIMNPSYSARKFFEALRRVRGWEGMPVTVAAQRVQRSAFPDAYAKHVGRANTLASQVGFDRGGLARGRGFMLKDVIAPERTLDPRQTVAFEQLVSGLTGRGVTPSQVVSDAQWRERGRGAGDSPLIGSLTVPAPEGGSARQVVDEVMAQARHARLAGRYHR